MSIVQSLILGVIQGLGEFLPISSSGHLLLARIFFGIQTDTPAMKMLDILLHVGTLLPVLIVFRKEWVDMILHPIRNRTLILLIVASVPTLAIYLLAKKFIVVNGFEGFAIFDSGWFLGVSFLITALFLLLCDFFASRKKPKEKKVGFLQAIVMGLFQGIGMIPGVSRSGSTILGGTATGLSKTLAAKFSFMMSAPAILGSLLMEGKDAVEEGYISQIELVPTVVGVIAAAVVGYLAIRFMLRIIAKVPLCWFALYLAVIGVAFLVFQFLGLLNVPPFAVPAAAALG
jgi:undecaprenyl-diphosphatase